MRRLLLVLVLLLPLWALCEDAEDHALTLPSATSVEEVTQFLLLPPTHSLANAERGYIRFISQNEERDDSFRKGYWLGDEAGSVLDLTLKERYGVKFDFHAGVMCSRAAYSMALSYLGIDMTPGDMSALMQSRNLDEPYDVISLQVGVERIQGDSKSFNAMFENYQTDPGYSPIYLYFRRPNGTTHAVLVVGIIPEKGRFLVVDSNPRRSAGKLHRVYFVSLNKARTEIINSTFRSELAGSQVLQIHQWKLLETEATPAP